jgi:hypothetical protein
MTAEIHPKLITLLAEVDGLKSKEAAPKSEKQRHPGMRQNDVSRPLCANSGHCPAVWRAGQIDPLLPFRIGPVRRRTPESGRRLNA